MKLLKNPLIKWAGILAIIYFALFSNKNNPDSLANRLSSSTIKKNLSEAKQKSEFIITNVKIAKSMAADNVDKSEADVIFEKLVISNSEEVSKCGDEVELLTSINSANGKNLSPSQIKKIIIGDKSDSLLEENIIGNSKDSVIRLKIKPSYKSENTELAAVLASQNQEIYYDILIKEIHPASKKNSTLNCQ